MKNVYLALVASLMALSGPAFSNDLMQSELEKTQARLDPVSAEILGSNQETWLERRAAIHGRISSFVEAGEVSPKKAEDLRQSLVSQRIDFLATLGTDVPKILSGGWTDGFRELLIDIPEGNSDRAARGKIGGFTKDLEGKRVACVVQGSVVKKDDGVSLALVPDQPTDRVLLIRRKGIALSIEEESGGRPFSAPPLCSEEGSLVGHYFYIDGSAMLIPFLMR